VNVTLGMRSAEQVERNAHLYGAPVPDELWADLAARGLIKSAG
jgi:D-threo-aldose 1-dehydrogenase